jgi:hypothetical protein
MSWQRHQAAMPAASVAAAFMLDDIASVVLALDFRKLVADGIEKILVGGNDHAIHCEFDHGLRPADGLRQRGFSIGATLPKLHVAKPLVSSGRARSIFS